MKNLYIIFFLILSGSINAQGNLENANWIFGNRAWLDFNNNALTSHSAPSYASGVTAYDTNEGCASVSDEDGNLLFFTDGVKVYRLNAAGQIVIPWNPVPTNLLGNTSSAQNIIIVPRPNTEGHYYLISVNRTGNSTSTSGIYWSELDLNTNKFLSVNTPMTDGSTVFNASYGNYTEAITSCIAADGENMWIIVSAKVINGDTTILSYRVTGATGIDSTPVGRFIIPLPTSPSIGNPPTSSGRNIPTSLKVASNAVNSVSRLALGLIGRNPIIGTFDRASGAITFFNIQIGSAPPLTNPRTTFDSYSVEFSPVNNDILYFSRQIGPQRTAIFAVDLSINPVAETLVTNRTSAGLQRGINNRIYAAFDNNQSQVLEIDNTGVYGSWILTDIGLGANSNSRLALPQWVWDNDCKPTLTLTNPANNVNGTNSKRQRSEWIKASNEIAASTTTNVIYHAGNFIELLPGFNAHSGARASAYIAGCTNNYVYKNRSGNEMHINEGPETLIKNLMVSPNPSRDFIDLTIKNDTFNKIIIAGIDGKIILDKTVEPTGSYNLDISKYASGVYIVNVVSESGKQYSQKLIKN